MATNSSFYGLPADDTTVLSRVNKIASDQGPLQQMARVEGLKAANRRGLLNSSMAVGASQDAVLRQALPIASQDASQAYGSSEAGLDRGQQLEVQQRQNTFAGQQNTQQQAWQAGQNTQQQAYQAGQNNLDRGLQQKIASWNLSSSDRNAASNLLSAFETNYEQSVNSILGNTGMDAASRNLYLKSATNLRNKRLNLVEQMYGINLKF